MKNGKILVPNAASPKNVGDLAILTSLLNLLGKRSRGRVIIHSFDPMLHKQRGRSKVRHSLYSYVAFERKSVFVRVFRLARLGLYYFLFKFDLFPGGRKMLQKDYLFKLCQDFSQAEKIIFLGGGYLRSKSGISQSLNLLMILFMFHFAKIFKGEKIVAPISFGPFAHRWQQKVAGKVLYGFDLVAVREKISLALLASEKVPHCHLASDLALLTKGKAKKSTGRSQILGFTVREWLPETKQRKFEGEVSRALFEIGRKRGVSIQPIIQVNAADFGENDQAAVARVISTLRQMNASLRPIEKVQGLGSAERIYSQIDLLLGMRMHSNILAAVCQTPYVGLAYEHKTTGISRDLGLSAYCLSCQKVTSWKQIYKKLEDAFDNRVALQTLLRKRLSSIRERENAFWQRRIHVV